MAHPSEQPSEMAIRESLIELLPKYKKILWSQLVLPLMLPRMESLLIAAHAAGRTPVIAGMSLIQNMNIAKRVRHIKRSAALCRSQAGS